MRSKTLLILSSLIIFTLLLSACGANTNTNSANNAPADNTSSQPTEEVTPMVEVSDQDASSGSVTIQKVVAADPGWIVIHTESDGSPGPIVGYAQVNAGENDNVTVGIDTGAATEKLFAMLHLDAGTMGTYEFPGDDVPVKNGDAIVMTPFMVTLPQASITPAVTVSDQETSGQVTIAEVYAADPGWIVIHTDSDGAPGPIVGYAPVQQGENEDVVVDIDLEAATEKLFAMLHLDAGTMGTYEFPGDDVPVKNGDAVVMTPFMITKAGMSMDSTEGATTVKIQDSKFIEKELTVKVGTTVTWVMEGNFPHTVTADDGSFDSGQMRNGETFSFTFNEVGVFPYYCSNHGAAGGQGMAGTITVTE